MGIENGGDSVIIDTTSFTNDSFPTNTDSCEPKWLNKGFVESHLQNYFSSKNLKIVRFNVQPATAKGENYASDLYRVNVTFVDYNSSRLAASNETFPVLFPHNCNILIISLDQQQDHNQTTMNIIIKSAVTGDIALKAMSSYDVYNKEITFYKCFAPKINELLAWLHDASQLIAMPYGVCRTNSAILFEDLSAKEYRISSIYRGFDFNDAVIVLKKLATFHACNAKIHEMSPNIVENFKYGLMTRHSTALDAYYCIQFDCMMEIVEKWPNADYYIPKLRRLRAQLMEKGAATFQPDANHFNTLIHGDLWMNNLMVRNSSTDRNGDVNGQSGTSIENVILIDFQHACWTSPAIDLHYIFNTSLQESLRPGRFDELLAIYHAHLVEYLKRLEYENHIPNFDQFKKQYQDKNFYGFVVACLVQPLMINENVEDANIEAILMKDERAMKFRRLLYSAAKVQANLRKLIPMYDEMGLFD